MNTREAETFARALGDGPWPSVSELRARYREVLSEFERATPISELRLTIQLGHIRESLLVAEARAALASVVQS